MVNQFLKSIGQEPVQWLLDADTALFAVAATTVWQNLGHHLHHPDRRPAGDPRRPLRESARVDGASAWLQFREITLPMLSPTLLFVSVILTINAFQSFGQIDLLTQGGPSDSTRVIVYSIYQEAFQNRNAGVASAQAVILFLIVLTLSLVQFRVLRAPGALRRGRAVSEVLAADRGAPPVPPSVKGAGWRKAGRYAALTFAAFIVLFPIYSALVVAIQPASSLLTWPGILIPNEISLLGLHEGLRRRATSASTCATASSSRR